MLTAGILTKFLYVYILVSSGVYSSLLAYFDMFGHKLCAFSDIRLYADILMEEQRHKVRQVWVLMVVRSYTSSVKMMLVVCLFVSHGFGVVPQNI